MKFSEKLQKLRKEKKLSQEQLAYQLDVSRQAVSKWESGQTYPEMDKLLSLCKLFGCSLDELTNDDIKEITVEDKSNSNINFIEQFITKLDEAFCMIKQMSFKEIIGAFVKLLLMIILLSWFHHYIERFNVLGLKIFDNFGVTIGSLLFSIWNFVLEISYGVLSIFILYYFYKRFIYDDFYQKHQNDKDDSIKFEVEEKKNNKEKVVITKQTSNPFWKIISNITLIFIKFCVVWIAVPFCFSLLFLCVALAIDVFLFFKGVFYIGIFLSIVAALILNIWLLECLIRFIFNKTFDFKRFLLTFLISICLLGLGIGISTLEIANTSYVNKLPDKFIISNDVRNISMDNKLYFSNDFNLKYKVDESKKDLVTIDVSYYEQYAKPNIEIIDNRVDINIYTINDIKLHDLSSEIVDNLKNKKFYNYSLLNEYQITVTTSSDNIDKLKKNKIQVDNDTYVASKNGEINSLEQQIRVLEDTIQNKDLENEKLKDEKTKLQEELEKSNEKLENYRNQLNQILQS